MFFVLKYDASGNIVYAKRAGGSGTDYGQAIAVDGLGNTIVTGYFNCAGLVGGTATFGSTTLTSAGDADLFLVKYNGAGNVVYAKRAGGTQRKYGLGVAIDASNNAIVTGFFSGNSIFGSTTLVSAGVGDDIFVAKFDSIGNDVWAKKFGNTGYDHGNGIAVDGSGNAYVTGYFTGTVNFGSVTLTGQGNDDLFITKLNTAGDVVYAKRVGSTVNFDFVYGNGIAVDGLGNAYVVGSFGGTATFGSNTLTSFSAGKDDIEVVKFDAAGSIIYATKLGGTGYDYGRGIDVDGVGNAYVTGTFSGTSTFGTTTLTSSGASDVVVAKVDGMGVVLWLVKAGGSTDDSGFGISIDGLGNVYCTGYFKGSTAAFGSTTLAS